MIRLWNLVLVVAFAFVALRPRSADAAVLTVPSAYPTIQAAVDAAAAGDTIRVSRGRHCGATITKPLRLIGRGGATIIGCANGPALPGGLRVGFFLPGAQGQNAASGTTVRGFRFDGEGISNTDLEPLALGIFARFAHDLRVTRNRFVGTVQAITNTAGDRWIIDRNRVSGLSLFDCTVRCSGGDGIVIGHARGSIAAPGGDGAPDNRAEDNLIRANSIAGRVPDSFSVFSMAGILVLSADRTTLLSNRLSLPDNQNADAVGQGIVISSTCCGETSARLPGSRGTVVAFNDGRRSEKAIVVEGSGGTNTEGLFLFRNRGLVEIEGVQTALLRFESPPTPQKTLIL
jgi:hypothetical protein